MLSMWISLAAWGQSDFVIGTHFHDVGKQRFDVVREVRSLRLWDARVGWNQLEPEPGRWQFAVLDKAVEEARARGVDLLLPLGLSPNWASANPMAESAYGPGESSPPARLADWENYVRTVVRRYRGRVQAYEIWNEPNRPRFFGGTKQDLFKLTCSASRIIREEDPGAKIVSPSPTDQDKGIEWLADFLDLPVAGCIDIVGFHLYTLAHEPPEKILPLISSLHTILQRKKLDGLPIWNTEFGWYIKNARVPNPIRYTQLDPLLARNYLLRSFILQAAEGIQRSYHYAWNNRQMGVVEPDTGEHKAVAEAYQAAGRWLAQRHISACVKAGDLYRCSVTGKDGGGFIYWSIGKRLYVDLPAGFRGAFLEQITGEQTAMAEGFYVDGAPVLLLKRS